MLRGLIEELNCPLYLPPPMFASVPINCPLDLLKTCKVAFELVLVASTFSLRLS